MDDGFIIKWELSIMLFAVWNWILVPFDSAFNPDFTSSIEMIVINSLVDVLFITDVIINFRITYVNSKTGEEIFDLKSITIHYLKGRFWIDLLSSIPFDMLTIITIEDSNINTSMFKVFSLLKLIRVLRLSKIVTYMNIKDSAKMSLKLAKLLFFLILYLHWQGCLWYLIVSSDEIWIPPLDFVYMETELYKESVIMQYLMSLYHSTVILAGGDIGPRGDVQLWFWIFALTFWAFINAIIFGNLAVLISSMNRKSAKFQNKLVSINSAMKNMKLLELIQHKVQDYITLTQSTLDHQQEMKVFMKLISPTLRLEVTRHIFSVVVRDNSIFTWEQHDLIIQFLWLQLYWPEDVIINQGDFSERMYLLAKGEVDIFITDENDKEWFIRTLKTGDYFGEVGIIKNWKRTATVKSKNYTTCASLDKIYFKELKLNNPKVFTNILYIIEFLFYAHKNDKRNFQLSR